MAEEKKTTTSQGAGKNCTKSEKDGAEGRNNGSGTTDDSEGGKKNVTGSIRNGGNKRSGSINRGSRYNVKGC